MENFHLKTLLTTPRIYSIIILIQLTLIAKEKDKMQEIVMDDNTVLAKHTATLIAKEKGKMQEIVMDDNITLVEHVASQTDSASTNKQNYMQDTITEDGDIVLQSRADLAGQGILASQPGIINHSADTTAVLRTELSKVIGQDKFAIWFKDSTTFILEDNHLEINVPNSFFANWIEGHFMSQLNLIIKKITNQTCQIKFNIDSSLSAKKSKTAATSTTITAKSSTCGTTKPNLHKKYKRKKRLKLSFDNFLVGKCNRLAYNAAASLAENPKGPFNHLFIHGKCGIGKTHLLQGICNHLRKTRPNANWLYLSAEDFANQFVMSLKNRKLEAFRQRLRRVDLLAIDDIHFLANKPSTQEEFFHTFNNIDLAGKQIALVSDAHPKMIEKLSEKLTSRFISGMVVKIETPDIEVRTGICRQFAKKMNQPIPEAVIKYLSDNLTSNVRELEGAVLKLAAISSIQNQKIDLSMATEVLSDHLITADPIVHTGEMEAVCAAFFGVTASDIQSSKKTRTIALARHFAMYLARKYTKLSCSDIGRAMGNKNHATVLTACKKINEHLQHNRSMNWRGPAGNRIEKTSAILAKLEQTIV